VRVSVCKSGGAGAHTASLLLAAARRFAGFADCRAQKTTIDDAGRRPLWSDCVRISFVFCKDNTSSDRK
jgi:hypothetical protein